MTKILIYFYQGCATDTPCNPGDITAHHPNYCDKYYDCTYNPPVITLIDKLTIPIKRLEGPQKAPNWR